MPTTQEKIAYLQGSVDSEMDDIMEKLPWYERVILGTALGVALGAAAVACGVVTIGSAGTAGVPCILALIALVAALLNYIVEWSSTSEEADALEQKMKDMEKLASEVE